MQVKIFESTDMASGLKLVKETLGPDALILSTRTIRSGKLGILGKPVLEITAAIDTPLPDAAPRYTRPAAAPSSPQKRPFTQWADEPTPQRKGASSEQPVTYDSRLRLHQEPLPFRDNEPVPRTELDELKEMVKKLGLEVSRLNTRGQATEEKKQSSEKNGAIRSQAATDVGEIPGARDNEEQLLTALCNQGISADTAAEIVRICRPLNLAVVQNTGDNTPACTPSQAISGLVHVAPPLCRDPENQRRIALIGPTGVGKTTTLAKIAAYYLSNFSNSIALITIDTYRIAAVEQLKVYGAIMNLPVEVVITPDQLEQAFARHSDKELILIDTAGRSPKDSLCIKELAAFLRPDHAIDKHLVLSATTRESELLETIRRFSILGIDNTIITKTDECSTLGVMLDIQMVDRSNIIPFSWITNGQRVPEDLLTATPELVAELITNSPGEIDLNQWESESDSVSSSNHITTT